MSKRKIFIGMLLSLFMNYFSVFCFGQSSKSYQLKNGRIISSAGLCNSTSYLFSQSDLGGFAGGNSSSSNFILNGVIILTSISDTLSAKTILPEFFRLRQNYPNPFNPVTTIEYSIPERTEVIIRIYNSVGEVVRTLLRETKAPGNYKVVWDSKNDQGMLLSSGIYYYDIWTARNHTVRKMILLK